MQIGGETRKAGLSGGGALGYLQDAGGDGDHVGEMGDGGAEALLEVAQEEQGAARRQAAQAGGGHGCGVRPRGRGPWRNHVIAAPSANRRRGSGHVRAADARRGGQ